MAGHPNPEGDPYIAQAAEALGPDATLPQIEDAADTLAAADDVLTDVDNSGGDA